jgi:hypothetical protein
MEPKRLQNLWHDVLLLFVQAEGLSLTLHRVISIRVTQWMIQRPPAWMHEMLCCFWFVVCSTLILFLFWVVCVQFMYLLQTVSINSDITCSCGPDYVTVTTETLHKIVTSHFIFHIPKIHHITLLPLTGISLSQQVSQQKCLCMFSFPFKLTSRTPLMYVDVVHTPVDCIL